SSLITIHVESTTDPASVLKKIKSAGVKPGITLRPQTSLKSVMPLLSLVDLALVMTVTPGWGGQSFMEDQLAKVKEIRAWAEKNNPKLHIEVDGGINADTAQQCRDAGANVFVAGHSVFKSKNYKEAIS